MRAKDWIGVLGWIWSAVYTLPGLLLAAVLAATGQIETVFFNAFAVLVIDFKNEGWFCRVLFRDRGWGGWALGAVVFVVDTDTERWTRTVVHESFHAYQHFVLGILFYPVYILLSGFIWLFMPNKHSYYDNPIEVAARRAAGQQIDIPAEKWRQGSRDRWIFWSF